MDAVPFSERAEPIRSVELLLDAAGPSPRHREPVSCGLPWPRGAVHDAACLTITDSAGTPYPLQARPLDSWPDGSLRWVLLDWQADVNGNAMYRVAILPDRPTPQSQ